MKTFSVLSIFICSILFCVMVMILAAGCVIKNHNIPLPPLRSAQNTEDAKKVAGAITDASRKANVEGLVPKSTESGTLVALAETNEGYVGSPAKREDPADTKAMTALIGAMQKQEAQFRSDRAAWEKKIDDLSRERDEYHAKVSVFGEQMARLKFWLFWLGVAGIAGCIFIPGFLWGVVRFFVGRVRAQFGQVVRGIEECREAKPEVVAAMQPFLGNRTDDNTKALIRKIKDEHYNRKRRS